MTIDIRRRVIVGVAAIAAVVAGVAAPSPALAASSTPPTNYAITATNCTTLNFDRWINLGDTVTITFLNSNYPSGPPANPCWTGNNTSYLTPNAAVATTVFTDTNGQTVTPAVPANFSAWPEGTLVITATGPGTYELGFATPYGGVNAAFRFDVRVPPGAPATPTVSVTGTTATVSTTRTGSGAASEPTTIVVTASPGDDTCSFAFDFFRPMGSCDIPNLAPGPYTFTATAQNSAGISDPSSASIPAGVNGPPLLIDKTPPLTGSVGVPYAGYTFTASGYPAPEFYVEQGTGSLPPGMSLDPVTGVLSGTPTRGGAFSFKVEATNTPGDDSSDLITITIFDPPSSPPELVPGAQVLSGTAGVAVTPTSVLRLVNFTLPARFSIYPTLPTGLVLDAATGVVSGTPTGAYPSTRHWITASAGGGSETAVSVLQVSVTGDATPTPAPDPVPVPPLPPGDSYLTVNGTPQAVTVEPNDQTNGVDITGDGFSMNLQGLDGKGRPLALGPDGVLILNNDRQVQTTGTGFQAVSEVDLYLDPPTLLTGPAVRGRTADAAARATSDQGTYVGTVITDAAGEFAGTATLPPGIAPGDHVIQAVGLSKAGAARAMSLGVRVLPSLELDQGTRAADGRHDRIRTTGTSTGIPAGTKLTPYIRYSGQTSFSKGKATITVQADGTFRWTRQIRKDKAVTGYVAWTDIDSNQVTWAKVR